MDPALYIDAQQRIFDLARQPRLVAVQRAVGSFAALRQSLLETAEDLAEVASDAAKAVATSLPSVNEQDMLALLKAKAPRPPVTRRRTARPTRPVASICLDRHDRRSIRTRLHDKPGNVLEHSGTRPSRSRTARDVDAGSHPSPP